MYEFNFIGESVHHTGMMAQEVYRLYPEVVLVGNDKRRDPWRIDYETLKKIIGDFRHGVID